jgi:hypothetical protein
MMLRSNIKILCLVSALWCSATTKSYASSADLSKVNIIFLDESKDQQSWFAKTNNLVGFCQSLASKIKKGTGPFGFGVFEDFGCYLAKQRIAGELHKAYWTLIIKRSANDVVLRWYSIRERESIGDQYYPLELVFTHYPGLMSELQKPHNMDLLALMLLDYLPVLAILDVNQSSTRTIPRDFVDGSTIPNDLKLRLYSESKFQSYDIGWDEEALIWRTQYRSQVKLKENSDDKGKFFWKENRTKISQENTGLDIGFHYVQGRGKFLKMLSDQLAVNINATKTKIENELQQIEAMKQAHTEFLEPENMSDTKHVHKFYVGGRLGVPVMSDDDFIKKSKYVGLDFLVEGGVFKGLKLHIELVPEVKRILPPSGQTALSLRGRELRFYSRKIKLGYTFNREYEEGLYHLNIQPRFSSNSVRVQKPLINSDGITSSIYDFKINNKFSMGVELGFELALDWVKLRLHYAHELFHYLSDDARGIAGIQMGVNGRFKLVTLSPTSSLYGSTFALYDSTFLKDTSRVAKGISFSSTYVGAGLGADF